MEDRAASIAAVVLIGLLCAARSHAAGAEGRDARVEAETYLEAGRAMYALGNYTDALRNFAAGYSLAPRPEILISMGETYYKLGQLRESREIYQRYLERSPPDDPRRPAVESEIVELDLELRGAPPAHAVTTR